MTIPNRFAFIQSLPSGGSRRDQELQQSSVRSHAAIVAHQRLRSRQPPRGGAAASRPKTRTRGKAVLPYHASGLPVPPPSPNDLHSEALTLSRTPWVGSINSPLSPPDSPEDVDYSSYPESTGGSQSDQEVENVAYNINSSYLRKSWRETSGTFSQPPFNTSLNYKPSPGLRTDPFFCIPSSADARIGLTLDFYSQVLSPSSDAVCYVFNVSNIYASFLEILQDEYFLDAGLSVIQLLHEQARAPGSQPSLQILRHKGNAIAKVREKLSRTAAPVDNVTLFAMVYLAVLEKGMRNSVAHGLHKRNIAATISQRGGLKSLQDGTLLKGSLMQFDTLWALETGATMFPGERRRYDRRYPSHPFSPELCDMITILPSGFHDLATACALSYDVLPVLYRAAHLTSLSTYNRLELLSKTRRSTRMYNDFWEACPCLAVSVFECNCSMLEKLLCLTLICYSFTAFGARSAPSALREPKFELTNKIALYSPKSPAEELCVIWMWIVLIDSWRTGNRLQPDGFSLLFNLQQRFPRLRYTENVSACGSQFLWTSELERSVKIYWDDLVSIG
jgi:hypothetical protein